MPKKKSERIAELDKKIEEALHQLRLGNFPSKHAAAMAFNIRPATFNARVKGGNSIAESREPYQLLSIPQETALVRWITRLTATGHPVRQSFIREMAQEIINQSRGEISANNQSIDLSVIGESWVQRFLHRHPELATVLSTTIEAARIKEVSKDRLVKWYAIVQEVITEYQILEENMYNMDETGCAIGTIESSQIVINKNLEMKYQAEPGRQEWVTIIECICGDGSSIAPLIIFKGENLSYNWISKEKAEDWHFSCNTKDWTSNFHGQEWMRKVFEPATRAKANGRTRLLICDGHDSHFTAPFILHCIQHNIILLLLPPHSSHLLQPLDVGIFGPLKKILSRHLYKLLSTGIHRLEKYEWTVCYDVARSEALNVNNIKAGWRGTGLIPFNKMRIIRSLPDIDEPSTSQSDSNESADISFNTYLTTDPPLDSNLVRSLIIKLNQQACMNTLNTPARQMMVKLNRHLETTIAEKIILKHQLKGTTEVVEARKE